MSQTEHVLLKLLIIIIFWIHHLFYSYSLEPNWCFGFFFSLPHITPMGHFTELLTRWQYCFTLQRSLDFSHILKSMLFSFSCLYNNISYQFDYQLSTINESIIASIMVNGANKMPTTIDYQYKSHNGGQRLNQRSCCSRLKNRCVLLNHNKQSTD